MNRRIENKTLNEVAANTGYPRRVVTISMKAFILVMKKILIRGMGVSIKNYFILRDKKEKFKPNREQTVDKF